MTDVVLISTDWLAQNLNAAMQRIVDCSWDLPDMERDAKTEFVANHIPGAIFFDIEANRHTVRREVLERYRC